LIRTTAYGLGSTVDTATGVYLNAFLYFYLTAVCGLSGTLAGLALALTLAVDAVADPLVGSWSDNTRTHLGRRAPFMFGSIAPTALSLVCLFSVPSSLRGPELFAYIVFFCLSLRIGLSLFNVPYQALGAELSSDYHRRSTLAILRVAISTVGSLAPTLLGYGVFLSARAGGQLQRAGYVPFAWSGAAMVVLGGLASTFGTLPKRGLPRAPKEARPKGRSNLLLEVLEVARNPSFVLLFCSFLIFFVAQGTAGALGLHALTFFWKLSPTQILLVSLAALPGVLIGVALAAFLNRIVEKRTLALSGLLAIFGCQLLPVGLAALQVIPTSAGPLVLAAANLLGGAGITFAVVGIQSMMADATDEHELRFGHRREGLYFAGISFAGKASSGLGVLLAGLAADAVHFPNDLVGAAIQPPWSAARDLALIQGPGAALVTLIPIVMLTGYGIDRREHARILQALALRRGESEHR
jgi:GPH family glycoside/pentoside/hexuronide:cation symporter